ncbi:protein prenylyltransferase superfamily protein isoform X2 [Wolffia australiana]
MIEESSSPGSASSGAFPFSSTMASVECKRGLDLLAQLEQILEEDDLIDELGFVHPTQLAELNANSGFGLLDLSNEAQSADRAMREGTDGRSILYDETVFWNRDHKLAISTTELPLLVVAAKKLFFDSYKKYKFSKNPEHDLQDDVLRHSKSFLLICSDNGTAWNSRKLVISRNLCLSLVMDELRLSALILSYSPKSENSWSHRRWTIKQFHRACGDFSDVVAKESELVKRIEERTKMNYRAWNHHSWFVSYMTWRQNEFDWNHRLIQCYIGREALWVHRRFLSQFWLNHLSSDPHSIPDVADFLQKELELIISFLSSPEDEFDANRTQGQLAASYFFWVLKVLKYSFPNGPLVKPWRNLSGLGLFMELLESSSPRRILLWRSFLGRQSWDELFNSLD